MINAAASVRRARAAIGSEFRQSGCLEAVYAWCGSPATRMPPGSFPSAIVAYRRTLGTPRLDWANAPAGAVHYWDGDPGHVALGTGNGRAVTTNAPQRVSSTRNGVKFALVGERTIPEIGRGRGRYLGWALDAFNNPISLAAPSGGSVTPIPIPEEDDVLTQQDKIDIAAMAANFLADREIAPGRKFWEIIRDADKLGEAIRDLPRAIVDRPVAGNVQLWQVLRALYERTPDAAAVAEISPEELGAAIARPEVAQALASAVLDVVKQRL